MPAHTFKDILLSNLMNRVAMLLSQKYRTLPVSVAQNIELLTHECIVRYCYHLYTGQRAKIPDSPVKYRTPGNLIDERRIR